MSQEKDLLKLVIDQKYDELFDSLMWRLHFLRCCVCFVIKKS